MADLPEPGLASRVDKGKDPAMDESETTLGGNAESHNTSAPSRIAQPVASSPPSERQSIDNVAPPPLPPRPSATAVPAASGPRQAVPTYYPQQTRHFTAKELAIQPHTHELRLLPPYNKNHSRIKLWLAMLLFSWGAALTTISAIVLADMLKVPVRPAQLDWVCYFGLPFGAIDMVWNAAEILTHCARGGESIYPRGIHSGAHVGVHLIMWLFSCVGICFGALSIEVFNAANVICNSPSNGAPYYPFLPYPFQSCTYYQRNPIFLDPTVEYVKSLLAGYCVTILVHLTLFVWACVDTHHRNRLSLGGLLAPPGPSGMFGDTAMTKLAESVPVQPIHQDVEKGQDATQEVPLVEAKVLQHPHNPILHSGAKDANHETTPATANEPIALTEEPQRS